MATAPTIAYLLLDAQYDPVFDPTVSLTDAQAVKQAILTKLRLFLGEWWENANLGLPVFQSMLGRLGSQRVQTAISLAIQSQIEAVPYVSRASNIQTSFVNGKFTFSATAQTAFGPVTVTNVPALTSSLG